MPDFDATVARDYATAVFHRNRTGNPDFLPTVDWSDQPLRHKVYPDLPVLALPERLPAQLGAAQRWLLSEPAGRPAGLTLPDLSWMLRLSYGLLGRRLRFDWNNDLAARSSYRGAVWSRGSASGGGLYPLEIYWVAGPSGPLLPGVYHYDTAHHGLVRLRLGDFSATVREALSGYPAGGSGIDQYLLVTVRFWKNAFKYGNFSYHVVTQDLGAFLGSWELLSRAAGLDQPAVMWFRDRVLNRLLDLDTEHESVFAVLPLPWARPPDPARPPRRGTDPAPVHHRSYERSRSVRTFPLASNLHLAALVDEQPRPDPAAARHAEVGGAAGSAGVDLPELDGDEFPTDLAEAFQERHSAFGGLAPQVPLAPVELGMLLGGGAGARSYLADHKPGRDGAAVTGLVVYAHRVTGVAPGVYWYDTGRHRLVTVVEGEYGAELQRTYGLSNYNFDNAAAVVAVVGRPDPLLDGFGNRGYRILNAEVGRVAQSIYLAAAAVGVECGAVLGFDNVGVDQLLGLDGSQHRTLLCLLVGHGIDDHARYDYRLV